MVTYLHDCRQWRTWVLIATQVGQCPCKIAQVANLERLSNMTDTQQQNLDSSLTAEERLGISHKVHLKKKKVLGKSENTKSWSQGVS